MAELALQLPVFIASPGDVEAERNIAADELEALAMSAARERLLIEPRRWEMDSRPGMGRPQDLINDLLTTSELAIVILWSRLGSPSSRQGTVTGTVEELLRASDQVIHGSSDDVLIYFRDDDPPDSARYTHEEVIEFRKKIEGSKSVYFSTYSGPEGFRSQIRHHLQLWIRRWQLVPNICVQTLRREAPGRRPTDSLGPNRISIIRQRFDYESETTRVTLLGRAAVDLYQRHGAEAQQVPLATVLSPTSLAALEVLVEASDTGTHDAMRLLQFLGRTELPPLPLRRENGQLFFAADEWFWFFCAAGLVDAIETNRVVAVEKLPYVNPVHQYLSALGSTRKPSLGPVLTEWLLNRQGITENRPVARNFAAYVLGMLGVMEAQEPLAEALEKDDGTDVKLYCAAALGKLRSRRYLSLLVRQYHDTDDPRLRSTAGQAVCRITGVALYEM